MKFKITNRADNSQKNPSLVYLSKSLSPNCIILRVKEEGLESIGLVTHEALVFFAVEWANYALQNYTKEKLPKTEACIALTRKWLEDQSSVSKEELRTAAESAYANTYAATAVANAAYAAAYASSAGEYVASAATNATYAAEAAGINKLDEQNRQGTFILNFFEAE